MLGSFTLRCGDRAVTIAGRSRKLCLLLACLILERYHPVPVKELIGLLWEGQAPGAGSPNALKAILHRARNSLDQLGEGAGRTLLLSREGCCQWNPAVPVQLDTDSFLRLCRQTDQRDQLAAGLEALALYRGDFLPDVDGHPWIRSKREELRRPYFQTVLTVLPLLSAQGRWAETAELAGTALELDPCQEELCRQQMEALLHLERQEEAAQLYERFQERLLARLGVMPSDPLQALYRQVRRGCDPRAISPVTLLERLREPARPGALLCDYDFFRVICHCVVRMAGRNGQPPHVALLSLTEKGGAALPRYSLDRCMDNLQGVILSRLRQGDAAARCSASQFVLLLPEASYENGRQVCIRILRAFVRQFPHAPAELKFSVQPLLPDPQQ